MGQNQNIPMRWLTKTGQTTSYADYDDGYYEAGKAPPTGSNRFTDSGKGYIIDKATKLIWVKQVELIIPGATGIHATNQIQAAKGNWLTATAYVKADLVYDTVGLKFYVCVVDHTSGVFADDLASGYWRETIWTASAADLESPAPMTFANALTNIAALEYAGYSDWRLANINELLSIINYDFYDPALDPIWPDHNKHSWISSTTCANDTTKILYCNIQYGFTATVAKTYGSYYPAICRRGV